MIKSDFLEYYDIIKPVIEHEEFKRRKKFMHHEDESVYIHCLKVSILSYKIAKKIGYDYKSAALGGILHDFYTKPWQSDKESKPLFEKHGFVHAKEALENSKKYFNELLNPKIENIIIRHMFPLNIMPPKYIEAWIVTFADKIVSSSVLMHPSQYPKYLGLKRSK